MNKIFNTLMIISSVIVGAGCSGEKQADGQGPEIQKQEIAATDGVFTPEIMHMLGKISDPKLSPDGKQILYGVTYTDIAQNAKRRILYIMNIDGTNNHPLTSIKKSAANARWIKEGKSIMFLQGGKLYTATAEGMEMKEVKEAPDGIEAFELSPKGDKIMYIKNIKACTKPVDVYSDLDKADARTVSQLMYRHWDHFVEEIPHTFIADFGNSGSKESSNKDKSINYNTLGESTDIVENDKFELPTLPFGGLEQLSWSPDENFIAYSCRKLTGKEYAFSTNTDIYLYNVATKQTENLSEGMMGYDTNPVFSPDGKYVAWMSMARNGYEADKIRLFTMERQTKVKKELSSDFKYNVESITWTPDSKNILFTSCVNGRTGIFQVDINKTAESKIADEMATGPIPAGYNYGAGIRRITADSLWYNFDAVAIAGTLGKGYNLITTNASMLRPAEIVAVNSETGEFKQLSQENTATLAKLKSPKVTERWMKTTDGKLMLTWVIYPPDFDSTKVYPGVMMCNGGPQTALDQSFSTRWNFRLMASKGYITILPNRRGCTSFGQPWCEQISGDYIGQNMKDYLTAVDLMKKEPYVGKVGAVGASYGGYSIYYLAGIHQNRFSAFIAHAGIFNQEQMYMMTEELWFPNWDNGGAPWDNNPIANRHYNNSPHKLIKNWNTPILITHGEMDYRVPVEQGMAAFNAAQMMGVPSKMVLFPDENHWILQPQNSVYWHRVFFDWLDKYCK
jgi:dipeptidyl aminopeptidase/acylaminoacyl peptidase